MHKGAGPVFSSAGIACCRTAALLALQLCTLVLSACSVLPCTTAPHRCALPCPALQAKRLEELDALYRDEAIMRKKIFNQMEDMKGKIRVYCRVRPILQMEKDRGQLGEQGGGWQGGQRGRRTVPDSASTGKCSLVQHAGTSQEAIARRKQATLSAQAAPRRCVAAVLLQVCLLTHSLPRLPCGSLPSPRPLCSCRGHPDPR